MALTKMWILHFNKKIKRKIHVHVEQIVSGGYQQQPNIWAR